MFDHITVKIHGPDVENVLDSPRVELWELRNLTTGEIFQPRTTNLGPLKIRRSSLNSIYVEGSIHFYFNWLKDGRPEKFVRRNWDQFTYCELCQAIDSLAADLGLSSERLVLHGFEFGQNLENPPFDVTKAKDSLILHLTKPFTIWESGLGRVAKHSQFHLKGYDKGFLASNGRKIFRLEIAVKKMQCLKGIGIHTLADLKDQEKIRVFFAWAYSQWESVLVHDPSVKDSDLNKRERPFWQLAGYVEHWKRWNSKQKAYNRDKVRAITARTVQTSLLSLILTEAKTTFERLMDSDDSYQLSELGQEQLLGESYQLSKPPKEAVLGDSYHIDEGEDSPNVGLGDSPPFKPVHPIHSELPSLDAKSEVRRCATCKADISNRGPLAKYCHRGRVCRDKASNDKKRKAKRLKVPDFGGLFAVSIYL